ncbi:D-alanine--D-alanine ligase [Candidatus Poribacteria bacterium]|nr:D-alanine--D-alanine ligase [Candidatus Poribacteria bacterium]
MKPLKIAFLYNIRHHYPDANDPRTHLEADFDDPKTIEVMIKHIEQCGYDVLPIEADQQAYFELYRYKHEIDMAFNYAEGLYGKDRESHLPAMLEMLQIPYTGSSPLTQAIVLNKAKTKEILIANHIPTLPFQVFYTPRSERSGLNGNLRFPLIVKPVSQGSSAGIVNKSVVNNTDELARQVHWVHRTFSQPALIEPFLMGREFSVAMLGNPPEILPIIEADHSALPENYQPLDSLEVKWYVEEEGGEDHLICPAQLNDRTKTQIKEMCYQLWSALRICDWCRVDIRCDKMGNPYVLEVNSPAGILPPEISITSYFPLAARCAGIEYDALIPKIIDTARKRYNL